MIPASGAYRNITGAQHAIHGAKPGEYSTVKFDINIVKEVMTYENKKKNSSFVAANNESKLGNVPK